MLESSFQFPLKCSRLANAIGEIITKPIIRIQAVTVRATRAPRLTNNIRRFIDSSTRNRSGDGKVYTGDPSRPPGYLKPESVDVGAVVCCCHHLPSGDA